MCFGENSGVIEIIATGGTGILTYGISPSFIMGTSNTFSGLTAGAYQILVQDEIGCQVTLSNITITEPTAALSATSTIQAETCLNANDGSFTIIVSGGTAPYQTSLDGITFTNTLTYSNLAGGQNYIVVS